MQTLNPNKLAITDWDVKWGTYGFGGVDKVTPDIKLVTKPKKVGSLGDVDLGAFIVGLSGSIKVEVREIDHTLYEQVVPWNNGTVQTSVPLFVPSKPADLYDYAKVLVLHPSTLASNVTNLDVVLSKAVLLNSYPGERDGVNDDKNVFEFIFFPDRAQFPNLVYGTIGQ